MTLFHGTTSELAAGDLLVPGRECGLSDLGAVWVTARLEDARLWGQWAARRRRLPTARVYEVQPVGARRRSGASFSCERATVVRLVSERPAVGRPEFAVALLSAGTLNAPVVALGRSVGKAAAAAEVLRHHLHEARDG